MFNATEVVMGPAARAMTYEVQKWNVNSDKVRPILVQASLARCPATEGDCVAAAPRQWHCRTVVGIPAVQTPVLAYDDFTPCLFGANLLHSKENAVTCNQNTCETPLISNGRHYPRSCMSPSPLACLVLKFGRTMVSGAVLHGCLQGHDTPFLHQC